MKLDSLTDNKGKYRVIGFLALLVANNFFALNQTAFIIVNATYTTLVSIIIIKRIKVIRESIVNIKKENSIASFLLILIYPFLILKYDMKFSFLTLCSTIAFFIYYLLIPIKKQSN